MSDEPQGNCFCVAAHITTAVGRTRPSIITEYEGVAPALETIRQLVESYDADTESVRTCHGWVVRPSDGLVHLHAWVEIDMGEEQKFTTVVLDYSNGHEAVVLRPDYYEAGQIKHEGVVRYTRTETLLNMVRHGHYGPWDDADSPTSE